MMLETHEGLSLVVTRRSSTRDDVSCWVVTRDVRDTRRFVVVTRRSSTRDDVSC